MIKSPNLKYINKFPKCHSCGNKTIIVNLKGRVFPYLKYELELTEDFLILGCSECDNFILGSNDCKLLDDALTLELERSLG